jgi:hypothetical protein
MNKGQVSVTANVQALHVWAHDNFSWNDGTQYQVHYMSDPRLQLQTYGLFLFHRGPLDTAQTPRLLGSRLDLGL